MNYCVLVKISKHSVYFWYQSDGSPYSPLKIKESNEVPLYFYVFGNDFIFGNIAKERFYSHDPNAYGNYFEIVKDPSKHFSIYGNKKPVKQLFYYGIEQYLSFFLNTVLYKSDSIESYRQNFPLRFLFDVDVEDKEKTLIETLFLEAGYDNVQRFDFNQSLFEVLLNESVLNSNKSVLLLNGIDNNLYLELYKNSFSEVTDFSKLEGQGADPRVKILADMIIEYISAQNSFLSIDTEVEIRYILPQTANILENITPIIKGEAELSDGSKYWFRVNERILNDRLLYYSNDSIIYSAIDDILKSNKISVEDIILLLGSEEINTSYFVKRLLKKYPNVKGIESSQFNDSMKLIFKKIAETGYTVLKKIPTAPPIIPLKNIDKFHPPIIKKPEIPVFNKSEIEINKVTESKKLYENYEQIISKPKLPEVLKDKKATIKSNENLEQNISKPKLPDSINDSKKNKNKIKVPQLPPIKK